MYVYVPVPYVINEKKAHCMCTYKLGGVPDKLCIFPADECNVAMYIVYVHVHVHVYTHMYMYT